MAFNNGFPVTYPQIYPQYQQQYQGYQNQIMTPPTIRAEIVQVDGEQAASNYPVGAGASQMMIAKDDSAIFVKSVLANGQATLDVFEKRPKSSPAEVFDPGRYVTREELENRIDGLLEAVRGKQEKERQKE